MIVMIGIKLKTSISKVRVKENDIKAYFYTLKYGAVDLQLNKTFMQVWRSHHLLYAFLVNDHLSRVSRQSHL